MIARILEGKTIALLATDGFEDSELTRPLEAVENAGGNVVIVSEREGHITGKEGTSVDVDAPLETANAMQFDGLLLPGGVASPDKMRANSGAIKFVRDFFAQNKPVAAICHAPWLLVEAGVLKGRRVTSWPSLKTDLHNAGANWVDQDVVTDHGLVTSRKPDDLNPFCIKVVEEFAEGKHTLQAA